MLAAFPRLAARALAGATLLLAAVAPACATHIERVISPGGIEVWLVQEPTVPLIAMDFAFGGGSAQDPDDKPGVASFVAGTIDEGSADLASRAFHEALESKAIELSFTATRDYFSGSLRTLVENKDAAFALARNCLVAPRFDAPDVERIRDELFAILRREGTTPTDIASDRWWAAAFPGHPYGRPLRGTPDSVRQITAADMRAYMARVLARDNLKVGIVGNIGPAEAGALVDKVFGELPAHASLHPVPAVSPQGLGRVLKVDYDVPQTVLMLGGVGVPRKDPDFMAAFLVNHILGGGSLSSRLYHEVREARGLVYSIGSALAPMDRTALFMTSTATRADAADQTLDLVTHEIHRLAESGPTEDELATAKSYLKGSFPLRFDTSTKIAAQLVLMQVEDMGIDYIDKRNGLIDAVTPADARRAAKRLLDRDMLVTMVGRSQAELAKSDTPGAAGGTSGPPALLKPH
jgi:zinc protease